MEHLDLHPRGPELVEDLSLGVFGLYQGDLEQGSKEEDPVVEDGSGDGFSSAINQANQLGTVGVCFSDVQYKFLTIVIGVVGPRGQDGSSHCVQ
jgi:hypothetical protein